MVQETQGLDRFGSRDAQYPTSCVIACIALGVVMVISVLRGSLPTLIYSEGTGLYGKS